MSQLQITPSDTQSEAPRSNYTYTTPSNLPSNTSRSLPLTLAHARALINAEAFAASLNIDTPLLAHITIHFNLSRDFKPSEWNTYQTYLLDKANCWLTRQKLPISYIWVREAGSVKGPHLHWFIHLPKPYWDDFKAFLLKTGSFEDYEEGSKAIVIEGGNYGTKVRSMRAGVLRYLLKSLDASPSTISQLNIKPVPSEPVQFQRCGATHSLSHKARSKAGWKELQSIEELSQHLNPPSQAKHSF